MISVKKNAFCVDETVLTVVKALAGWVYVLWGLWGIKTAAAKVALTQADGICFNTLCECACLCMCVWRWWCAGGDVGGTAAGLFPRIVLHCRSISDNTPPWKTCTFPRNSVPTGPKVFICIDYRLHVLFSLISIVLQMNMYAFNYQVNLPSSNSDNIGSGTAHNTHGCCETSPGCCV